MGACFEEPLQILKSSVQTFLSTQASVLNLVDLIIPFRHDDIKIHLVKNLVKTGYKFPVKTFKALRDIEESIGDKEITFDPHAPTPIDTKTANDVIHACIRGLEDCMHSGDKRMVDIVPDADSAHFIGLFQLWKINWCSNCNSACCRNGGE